MQLSPFVTDFLSVVQPLAIGGLIFASGKMYQGFITVQKELKSIKDSTAKLLISQGKTESQLVFLEQFGQVQAALSTTVAVNCNRLSSLEKNHLSI